MSYIVTIWFFYELLSVPTPGHHALINNTCTCLPESKDVIEGKATCRRLPIANWLFYELLGVPNLGHQVLIINVLAYQRAKMS